MLLQGFRIPWTRRVFRLFTRCSHGNEAKERLACNYSGDDMEIGFNSRFFQEMLGNLSQQEILLEMSAPNRAGLILPIDNQNADEDISMLLMPVMLN